MRRILRWLVPFCIVYAAFAPHATAAPLAAPAPASPEAPAGGAVNTCTYWALRMAMLGGGTVTFNCSGTIVFTETWTVTATTVIDGNGFNVNLSGGNARHLFLVNAGRKLSLRRLTVRDGYNDNIVSNVGGGCLRVFGALDLITATIRDCQATAPAVSPSGGAIYASGAVVQMTNTQMFGNSAKGFGGAIYAASTHVRLHTSEARSNTAYSGGGVYHTQGSADYIQSAVLSNTAQVHGGGLYASNVVTLNVLSASELSHNRVTSATAGVGGGAYFTQSRPYIDGVTIVYNESAYAAGAIYMGGTNGTMALYNSLVADNQAPGVGPGGVHVDGSSASIYDNVFQGNYGYPYGGALRNSARFDSNTGYNQFINNDAYYGGGIYNDGGRSIQIYETVFEGNNGAYGAALHNDGSINYAIGLTFTHNAAAWRGGAYASDMSKAFAYFTDVVMLNNTATQQVGGGIYASGNVTVTLSNAKVNGNIVGLHGGGIYLEDGYLRVRDGDISDNRYTGVTSTSSGIGLYAIGTARTHFQNVTVNRNQAGYLAQGAAMHIEGAATLNNITANDNRANGAGDGGAMYFENAVADVFTATLRRNIGMYSGGGIYARNSTLNVSYATVAENRASAYGGGIYAIGTTLNLFYAKVTDHTGSISSGAGVYCYDCTGTWRYNTLSRNIGDVSGGGLFAYDSALRVEATLFNDNGSRDGGGVYVDRSKLWITNTTLSGNWAIQEGGGIYGNAANPASHFTLTNVTIKDNGAAAGGGVYIETDNASQSAEGFLRNTVIADSMGGGNCSGKALKAAVYSLSTDFTCVLSGLSATNKPDGTPAQLGGLQYNGGWHKSHMPITGSVLIDGVTGPIGPILDQRGASRPQGLGFDIGAVEFGVSVPNLVPFYQQYAPATRRDAASDW